MKVISTATQNLVKDGDTGVYYARLKIQGLNKYRSLDTKVSTTAKLRLQDKLNEIRESVPTGTVASGLDLKSTFEEVALIYTQQVQADPKLRPASKKVRLRPIATLRRTWPELFGMEVRRVTAASISGYIADFERGKWPYLHFLAKTKTVAGNSASTFNKLVTCLRDTFELAVKAHVIAKNPAADLTYQRPRKKLLNLPNKSQFKKIVHRIRTQAGKARIAGDFVEGLSYSGLRLEEANALLWQDLDHERRMMTVKGTKTEGSARIIPMTQAFHALTLGMTSHRESILGRPVLPHEKVFEVTEASVSLANACKEVGVKKLTHHDLRHLFATTCIESGVDIPTVAGWLGHADGGMLAMNTYGHIRPSHSSEAAQKVRF